jgi:hypothetical protein
MPTPAMPDRLRFTEFELERLSNGRCRARVTLTLMDDMQYKGESDGLASQAGELRCCAQACVEALGRSVGDAVKFELFGVKSVRAFDSQVVIVSLALAGESGNHRVVGCCLTDDPCRGAALAVLNATNRVLGNRFFMR